MKPGQWLRLEWSSPRNGKHHRKLWALLTLLQQNSETYDMKEKAPVAIKLAADYFDPHVDPETGGGAEGALGSSLRCCSQGGS